MVVHLLNVITLSSLDETDRHAREIPLINRCFHCATFRHIAVVIQLKMELIQKVKLLLIAVNKTLMHEDFGRLLLRLAVALLGAGRFAVVSDPVWK
ncbi:hypothetical protein J5S76_15530 [Bacillus amyloliquefaciens]|nr:hypothetical protein [Bacillus amyloliquefaciens]